MGTRHTFTGHSSGEASPIGEWRRRSSWLQSSGWHFLAREWVALSCARVGLIKVEGGIDGNVAYYLSLFEDTLLPAVLVEIHATSIMFVEFALAACLISGFKLRLAWIASALTLISLAFGMMFAFKFTISSGNYAYVVICCLGLLVAPYDKLRVGMARPSREADQGKSAD